MNEISRVPRSKAEARAAYNRMSRWYDRVAAAAEARLVGRGLARLAVRPGETALEIGAGTGRGAVALAAAVGPEGRVLALDLAERMLAVTAGRAAAAGCAERVAPLCADGAALPLAAGAIDAVFMSFALELFDTPEIPAVLGECRRVLRAGGRLCAVAMAATPAPGPAARLYEWARRRFPATVDCRPIRAAAAFADAGFTAVESERGSLFGLPVDVVWAAKAPWAPAS